MSASRWPYGGGTDPKAFWEKKILVWETGRYEKKTTGGFLEFLADRASDSLRFRLSSSAELLAPHVAAAQTHRSRSWLRSATLAGVLRSHAASPLLATRAQAPAERERFLFFKGTMYFI